MKSRIFLVGSTHHNAPLEVREKLALSNEDTDQIYTYFKKSSAIEECLVLNTCNRVEIYAVSQSSTDEVYENVINFMSELHGMESEFYEKYSFYKEGENVIEHIFEVASGVDSQIIGENEIFGQVKKSYKMAGVHGTVGKMLNRVFQKSFQAAKWIRSNTAISKGQVSVGNICVDLAVRIFGHLQDCNAMIIGTGEVAEKTIDALKSRGCHSCSVTGRNLEKSKELAETYNGTVVDYDTYQKSLHLYDIVIASTAAPEIILKKETIAKSIAKKKGLPIFFIDLAVPRDVDPEAADLESVFLYNMDDLSQIANENLKSREDEIEKCKRTLKDRARYLWNHLNNRISDQSNSET